MARQQLGIDGNIYLRAASNQHQAGSVSMGAIKGPDGQPPAIFIRANQHRAEHGYKAHDPIVLLARNGGWQGPVDQLAEQLVPDHAATCTFTSRPIEHTGRHGQSTHVSGVSANPRLLVNKLAEDFPGREVRWVWAKDRMEVTLLPERGNTLSGNGMTFVLAGYPQYIR